MALGGTYSTGTVNVINGSVTVPGAGVIWSDVVEGDWISVGTAVGIIDSVNAGYNQITLKDAWAGDSATATAYRILKMSWLRYDPSLTQERLRTFIVDIEAAGLFLFVSGATPDPSLGEDGQYALKTNAVPWQLWYKTGGVWVSQGAPSGVNWRGTWSSATSYLVGDAVTRLGSSYAAIQIGTNQPPESSGTYWQLIATSGGRYDIGAWASDRPASSEQLLNFIIPTAVTFYAGLANSFARAQTAATTSAAFSLRKNDAQFGTVTFAGTYPNLLSYSHNLANSIWARTSLDPTATLTASDGVETLNKLIPDPSNVRHKIAESVTVSAQAYTLSAEIKTGEYGWIGLSFGGGANVDGAYFNASTGAVGTTAAGTTAATTSLGGGFYRVSITRTLAAGTAQAQIEPHSANNQTAFAGNNTSGVYAGKVQFEAASSASAYVSTVSPGSIGTFAAATDTAFAAGDVLGIVTPNPRDPTLAGITLTVTGFR